MLIKCSQLKNVQPWRVCAAKKEKKKLHFIICSNVVKCNKKIVYLELEVKSADF